MMEEMVEESLKDKGNLLESALIDQKMRAEKHKSNFDSLKAQHLALQEKFQNMRFEYDSLLENYDRLHHKSQEIIQTLQMERDDKIMECEELKKQTFTGLKLEQLKMQLIDEIEEPLRKRSTAMEAELEVLRSEDNKLKYSYTCLKSEFDNLKINHETIVQELCAKHKMEVMSLTEENRKLQLRQERDVAGDLLRIRQVERENGELQQRIKVLVSENEELQAQKEMVAELGKQSDQAHSRQLAELQAANKTLELERASLAEQNQGLLGQLTKSYNEHQELSEKLSSSERKLVNLQRSVEVSKHKHEMEISELKMKSMEQCKRLESEKEQYASDLMICQAQLESLTKALHNHDAHIAAKEQQIEQRVQAAREKEWEKQVALEKEKVELEEKIAHLKGQQSSVATQHRAKTEKLEAQLQDTRSEKCKLETEVEILTRQIQEQEDQMAPLLSEMDQLTIVSKKYQTLFMEHKGLQQTEMSLRESCKKQEELVHHLEVELDKCRQASAQAMEALKRQLEEDRRSWCEEKEVLSRRMEEMETRQQTTNQQLLETKKESKKLQRHYKNQVNELKQITDLRTAELAKLESEKNATETSMKLELKKVKGQLAEMHRKRKEFLCILQQQQPHELTSDTAKPCKDPVTCQQNELEEVSRRISDLEASHDLHRIQLLSAAAFVNQHSSSLGTLQEEPSVTDPTHNLPPPQVFFGVPSVSSDS